MKDVRADTIYQISGLESVGRVVLFEIRGLKGALPTLFTFAFLLTFP